MKKLENLAKNGQFNPKNRQIVILDTETTGIGKNDRVIQLAYITMNEEIVKYKANYALPQNVSISLEAMMTHHITPRMLEKCEAFAANLHDFKNSVVIAHNAKFDCDILKKEGVEFGDVIDTLSVFRAVWRGMPNHKLQYLRYALGVDDIYDLGRIDAHDALSDVTILWALVELASVQMTLEDMIEASKGVVKDGKSEPIMLMNFTFGKYNGRKILDVAKEDTQYCEWLYSKITESPEPKNADLAFTLKSILGK